MTKVLPFPRQRQVDPRVHVEGCVRGTTVVLTTRFPDGTKLTEFLTAEEATEASVLLRDLAADALNNERKR